MAFNEAPSDFFGAGYALSSSEVRLNTNTNGGTKLLTKLTDTQANATTGDARDVSRALCYMLYEQWLALTNTEKPVQMKFEKNVTVLAPTADNPQALQEQFTFTFNVTSDPQGVINEP